MEILAVLGHSRLKMREAYKVVIVVALLASSSVVRGAEVRDGKICPVGGDVACNTFCCLTTKDYGYCDTKKVCHCWGPKTRDHSSCSVSVLLYEATPDSQKERILIDQRQRWQQREKERNHRRIPSSTVDDQEKERLEPIELAAKRMKRTSERPPTSTRESSGQDNRTSVTGKKKVKKDEAKDASRDGASSAKQQQHHMKSGWTIEELDLNKDIFSLHSFIGDRSQLGEKLFQVLSGEDISRLFPPGLEEMPLSKLKQLCMDELCSDSLSDDLLRSILGNDDGAEDKGAKDSGKSTEKSSSSAEKGSQREKSEAAESKNAPTAMPPTASGSSQRKKGDKEGKARGSKQAKEASAGGSGRRDVEIQVVSSLESSSSSSSSGGEDNEDSANEKSNEGWMNLWAKTQMEILELEMRARAIRSLLKKDEETKKEASSSAGDGVTLEESQPEELIKSSSSPPIESEENSSTLDSLHTSAKVALKAKDSDQQDGLYNSPTSIAGLEIEPSSAAVRIEKQEIEADLESSAKVVDMTIPDQAPTSGDVDDVVRMGGNGKCSAVQGKPQTATVRSDKKAESVDEIQLQHNDDSDDSIDRELKSDRASDF